MALKKAPYKGCRDFFPEDKRLRDYLFDTMREVAERFGYEPYDGPLLEEVDLYRAKSGEELINEQIYSFFDRGERHVAIRPEMTPTVARMVAQAYRKVPLPIRWYSIPNLMRYEKPQKGRLREHWQLNCDIFGAPGESGTLEILQLLIQLFEALGATQQHFEIRLNDRRVVDGVFQGLLGADEQQAYRLYKIVDRSKKITPEQLDAQIAEVGLTADKAQIFRSYLELQGFDELLAFLNEQQCLVGAEEFTSFVEQAKSLGLDAYLVYDPTVVRGLDYYTGTVFEFFDKHPDNRRALCGGGAYANLLQIFDEGPLAGVGFGLGDVTLRDFLDVHGLLPDTRRPNVDVLVTVQTTAALASAQMFANELRKAGLRIVMQLAPIKINKVFAAAEKRGARCVALLGDDELARAKVQIKHLESREQQEFDLSMAQAAVRWICDFQQAQASPV